MSTPKDKAKGTAELPNGQGQAAWFYLKDGHERTGPVSVRELPQGPNTLVWQDGMETWKARKDISQLNAVTKQYYYVDVHGARQGPVGKWDLVNLLTADGISPDTHGWKDGMDDWKPLFEFPELKSVGFVRPPSGSTNGSQQQEGDITKIWCYEDNYRNEKGPVSIEEMGRLFGASQLHLKTICWKVGTSDRKEFEQHPELKSISSTQKVSASSSKEESTTKKASDKTNTVVDGAPVQTTPQEPNSKRKLSEESKENEQKQKKKRKKKKKKKRTHWKDVKNNSSIYVTGLPKDVTKEELEERFAKCGLIKKDMSTGESRIKIYKDGKGCVKGDGLITYLKEESVGLAVQLLHESDLRPDCKIGVQPAKFEMKGEKFIPKEANKAQEENPVKMALQKRLKASHNQEMDLSWDDDAIVKKKHAGLRIVVLKHMFTPSEAAQTQNKESFYDELEIEIGVECERVGGPIEKLTLFRDNAEGAVAIKYKSPEGAFKCIETMNGRFFAGRKVECDYFDGTNYKAQENEEDEQARLDAFGSWLESGAAEESTEQTGSSMSKQNTSSSNGDSKQNVGD